MNVSFTLAWWHVPTIITVLAIGLACLWPDRGNYFSDTIGRLCWFVVALLVCLVVWIIAAVLK